MTHYYEQDGITIYHGDCREVMRGLEAESVDAIVTDPPYGLSFMGKGWDHGVPGVPFWVEALRVAKPGAHLLAFGGTRTFHRLACAIEDAGWEIRDCVMWVYGSGFPKSLNVGKAIDKRGGYPHLARSIGEAIKAARESRGMSVGECDKRFCGGSTNWSWFEGRPVGQRAPTPETFAAIAEAWPELAPLAEKVAEAEREVVGQKDGTHPANHFNASNFAEGAQGRAKLDITAPATDAAKLWDGWGTALKPAWEPIILARKPLDGTVAANVLKHGTGALNIDGCRVGTEQRFNAAAGNKPGGNSLTLSVVGMPQDAAGRTVKGRWPANMIHDGSEEVVGLFPSPHGAGCKRGKGESVQTNDGAMFGLGNHDGNGVRYGDSGSAARFFYCAKAPRSERLTYLTCNCETVKLCAWVSEDRNRSERTGSTSPDLDTSEGWSTDGGSSSTSKRGNEGMDLFQQVIAFTTSTETSRTTGSKTSNLSRTQNTSESTEGAKSEMASGSSRAVFAGECFHSMPSTFICHPKDGRFTGVVVGATSPLSSGISVCEGCGSEVRKTSHPTQKPERLMRYLCRLVTPPGGIVLDPFMGSGSTLRAAKAEGFRAMGIELEEKYCEIAAHRLSSPQHL
jgi:hypothetical protein